MGYINGDRLGDASVVVRATEENPISLTTKVYRYLPVDRFLEMVEKGVNVLTHLTHWEDPFEAFVLRAGISDASNETEELSLYDFYKHVYGQSWMANPDEQDVLWRAYCPNKDGVRITTSVGALFDMVKGKADSDTLLRIGAVAYHDQHEFDECLCETNLRSILEGCDTTLLDLLFMKRREFSLEREVRVAGVFTDDVLDKDKDVDGSLLKFAIDDPGTFIEEVLVDPRMDRRKYEQLVCRVRHRYPQIDVYQSRLYQWPCVNVNVPENLVTHGFWVRVRDALEAQLRYLQTKKCPRTERYWVLTSHNGYNYVLVATNSEARVELYLNNRDQGENKRRYDGLLRRRTEIETDLNVNGAFWRWERLDNKRASRISIVLDDVSFANHSTWERIIDWFQSVTQRFIAHMNQYVQGF